MTTTAVVESEKNSANMHNNSDHLLQSDALITINNLESESFIIGSILDNETVGNVVEMMSKEGIGIGGLNETVCYIIGDASNANYIDSVVRLKGDDRRGMAMALSHTAKKFAQLVDKDAIPHDMKQYFENHELMDQTFGGLAFLRVPVDQNAISQLSPSVISGLDTSRPMIQNWLPTNAMRFLVEEMERCGMTVGITSLNRHGLGSIFNQVKAAQLAKEYLGGFLYDPRYPNDISEKPLNGKPRLPYGSYPIIEIGTHIEHGVSLVREGAFDRRAIMKLLGNRILVGPPVQTAETIAFPDEVIEEMERANNPQHVRSMISTYLQGLLAGLRN